MPMGSVPLGSVPSITFLPSSSPALMCVHPLGESIASITSIRASASNERPLMPPMDRTRASEENSTSPMAVEVSLSTNWRTRLRANSLSCEW